MRSAHYFVGTELLILRAAGILMQRRWLHTGTTVARRFLILFAMRATTATAG